MNETDIIVTHLAESRYADIPQEAIDAAKRDIFDTLDFDYSAYYSLITVKSLFRHPFSLNLRPDSAAILA